MVMRWSRKPVGEIPCRFESYTLRNVQICFANFTLLRRLISKKLLRFAVNIFYRVTEKYWILKKPKQQIQAEVYYNYQKASS